MFCPLLRRKRDSGCVRERPTTRAKALLSGECLRVPTTYERIIVSSILNLLRAFRE
jgi:hypothetical protein